MIEANKTIFVYLLCFLVLRCVVLLDGNLNFKNMRDINAKRQSLLLSLFEKAYRLASNRSCVSKYKQPIEAVRMKGQLVSLVKQALKFYGFMLRIHRGQNSQYS